MDETVRYDSILSEERQPRIVRCRLIQYDGDARLVEWIDKKGMCQRVSVPSEFVEVITPGRTAVRVSEDVLKVGIPYGLPLEEFVVIDVTSKEVANALRMAGIWTRHDIVMNPDKVRGAIGRCIGISYGALLKKTKRYKEVSNE